MKKTALYSALLAMVSYHQDAKAIPQTKSPYFIENKGQIIDAGNKKIPGIQYKLEAGNMAAFIGNGAIHYQFAKQNTTCQLNVVLEHFNKAAFIEPKDIQAYHETYYLPQCYGATARSFTKLVYKNVYNHIDWILYIKENNLEYDFVVHPGGNVKDIKVRYDGATKLELVNGSLVAATPFGSITESAPVTYNEADKKQIASTFTLQNNTLGFAVEKHKGTVVIDPRLVWATYYGDSMTEAANTLTSDGAGNIYMAGSTLSSHDVATIGTFAGNSDGLIVKFNPAGQRIWATYFGGTGNDLFNSIVADQNGNLYAAGNELNSPGIATTGAHQGAAGGGSDAILAKFDTSGILKWATYYGAAGTEFGNAVACDGAGNVYIGGSTNSPSGNTIIATAGSFKTTYSVATAGFIAKFAPSGARIWGTYYGEAGTVVNSLSCDNKGNIYAAGNTADITANRISTIGTQQSLIGGGTDGFIVKLDSSGVSRKWGTYLGGTGTDFIKMTTDDGHGNLYTCGQTTSLTNMATKGSFKDTLINALTDAFLAKYDDSLGKFIWSTYYGGPGADIFNAVALNGSGHVFAVGTTSSRTSISVGGGHQDSLSTDPLLPLLNDAFLVMFDTNGYRYAASYHGGTANESGNAITTSNTGYLYLAGNTSSAQGIATTGNFKDTLTGIQNDAFLARYLEEAFTVNQPFNDTLFCPGDTLLINYTAHRNFGAGNIFTTQLSNIAGNFAVPVNLGTLPATGSGTIKSVLPYNTTGGTGYRIRITSTIPPDTSYADVKDIHIKDGPGLPIATANAPICEGGTVHIIAGAPGVGTTYSWTGPNGFSTTVQSINYNGALASDSGNYIVTASLNGCKAKDTALLVVYHRSTVLHPTYNGPICEGDTLRLQASGNTIPGVHYQWTGPNGFADTSIKPVKNKATAAAGGVYHILASLTTVCGIDSIAVKVIPKPTGVKASSNSPITAGDQLNLFATSDSSNVIYSWRGPLSFISDFENPTVGGTTVSMSGVYTVTVSEGNCKSTDSTIVVVNEEPGALFSLYPNPSINTTITIKGQTPNNDPFTFRITDISGQTVYTGSITPVNNSFITPIDLPNLANGVYRLSMKINEDVKTYSFTMKR